MNFPRTVEELVNWEVKTAKDKLGNIHVITGYEGTGRCFWCGQVLTGRQIRYCPDHWEYYWNFFSWPYARTWCARRYYHQCANCGISERQYNWEESKYEGAFLEVHHIIPLDGQDRVWSVYNVPWNLIYLCHRCHLLVHAIMRESTSSTVLDTYELAMVRGQGFFHSMV